METVGRPISLERLPEPSFSTTVETPRAKHYLKPALILFLSLPVLYVLSAGPAVMIFYHRLDWERPAPRWAEYAFQFYAPLAIIEEYPAAGKLLDWYLNLWVPGPESPEP